MTTQTWRDRFTEAIEFHRTQLPDRFVSNPHFPRSDAPCTRGKCEMRYAFTVEGK